MKNSLLILPVLLLCFAQTSGQVTFQKLYSWTGIPSSEVVQTSDSCYVTSSLYGFGVPPHIPTLIKLSSIGDTLWNRQYTSPDSTFGWNSYFGTIRQTTDGGFLLVNGAIVKTDS